MKKTEKKFEELAQAAIGHWTDMFKNPEYSDRANGGQLGGFESILMSFAKVAVNSRQEIKDEQIALFGEEMRKYIRDKFDKKLECKFETDWAPEYPLSDFISKAKLPNTMFPSRYDMYIDFESGTVRAGGIGRTKQIYPVK